MKCPHCGAPMADEQIFCETCGKERELVPLYEADIDETIEDAISGIAVDLANTQEIKPIRPEQLLTQEQEKELSEEEEFEDIESRKGTSARFLIFMIGSVVFVVFLVLAVISVYRMRQQSSYDFHIKKAEEMSRVENYEQMLQHANSAQDIAPNSSDAKMLIARAYEGMGNTQYEREMLEDLLAADNAYAPAYELLIPLYENDGEYQKIADILEVCTEQTVLDKYVDYLAAIPQTSEEPGNYEEALAVKLIGPGTGKIYYTLDGTDPVEKGKEYMTPIVLHSGKYLLKTVYVNTYQISSDVLQAEFFIDEQIIPAPEVSLPSGNYTEPQYISVETTDDEHQVYYTTDGTEPTMESTLYEGAIPLPLGNSQFAFAVYDENGIPGEIAYAQYRFEMELSFTGEQASNMLIQTLISQGVLTDADGRMADVEGKKQYVTDTIIAENDGYYYLLNEIYIAPDGISQKTGDVYAVSATTGESYRAIRNALGMYELRRMQ